MTLSHTLTHIHTAANTGLQRGLVGLAVAFMVAVAIMPLIIRLAHRLGVIDRPSGNKIHKRATPLMGGVAVAIAFLSVSIGLFWLLEGRGGDSGLRGLLVGCALAALLGVVDELRTLPPRTHFIGQIAVVIVALFAGFPRITQISNPFHNVEVSHSASIYLSQLIPFIQAHSPDDPTTVVLGTAFTVFWIVGMMNTVNFLDGLDGLAGGVTAIAALFLGLWAVVITQSNYAYSMDNQNTILPLILCGAILGFLRYNWAPARIFMGDSGSMFIGFSLGALSLFGPVKLGTALLLLIIPIIDVAWAIVRRLLGRRSFASGDKHHIYHRMLELGLSRRTVVLIFYGLCLALGIIDLNLVKWHKLLAFAIVAVLTGSAAVALELRGRQAEELRRTAAPGPTPAMEQ